jgi:non-heme chloroperoxidase
MGYYIEVEKNVKLFVEDIGEGIPVVFIHGWPVNHKMFEYQFTQLPKEGFRCIGIDLRGFGKSDCPWKSYSYNRMADDIRAVIDELKLNEVNLAGFSVGGAISVRYMARHSGYKVSKLVLIGAAAPSFIQRDDYAYGKTKEEVDDIIKSIHTDRPQMAADFGKIFLEKDVSEPFGNWLHGLSIEASAHGTIKVMESLRDEDLREDLGKIKVSTAIFHGELDQICPIAFGEMMNEKIENSKLIRFEESGHGTLFDEKDKFNKELIKFLT